MLIAKAANYVHMHLICWQTPPYSTLNCCSWQFPRTRTLHCLSTIGSPMEGNETIQLVKTRQILTCFPGLGPQREAKKKSGALHGFGSTRKHSVLLLKWQPCLLKQGLSPQAKPGMSRALNLKLTVVLQLSTKEGKAEDGKMQWGLENSLSFFFFFAIIILMGKKCCGLKSIISLQCLQL